MSRRAFITVGACLGMAYAIFALFVTPVGPVAPLFAWLADTVVGHANEAVVFAVMLFGLPAFCILLGAGLGLAASFLIRGKKAK
jgi:hypothetical protein